MGCVESKYSDPSVDSSAAHRHWRRHCRLVREPVPRRFGHSLEGEQVAAGWPSWLSAAAPEAIHGLIPMDLHDFRIRRKAGKGAFSTVFKAREINTGKFFALKQVQVTDFQPESVRFMAREIKILRRLDHPNVMKLEGVIASPLSCDLYLVFEYMDHDLDRLSFSPVIKFSLAQVKSYMKQLLLGLEHCHSRGILHRDIKGANLLVNNQGVLKVADFGLAKQCDPSRNYPMRKQVGTLSYRAPEILIGSTHYDSSVDLWSAGCVFAEMLRRRPIPEGTDELDQLHLIYKLCGLPVDDYWKKPWLYNATVPPFTYRSNIRHAFKELLEPALSLLETLLSVEPYNRGTASYALASEFFRTEPIRLPKYAPNKEMDREERHRRKASCYYSRGHHPEYSRRGCLHSYIPDSNVGLSFARGSTDVYGYWMHSSNGDRSGYPRPECQASSRGYPHSYILDSSVGLSFARGSTDVYGDWMYSPYGGRSSYLQPEWLPTHW